MQKTISKCLAGILAMALFLGVSVTSSEAGVALKDPPPAMQGLERLVMASLATASAPTSSGVIGVPVKYGSKFVNNFYGISCWRGSTSHAEYNSGLLKWRATMKVEWCAAGGKVIDKTVTSCISSAGYFRTSQKCTVKEFGTGYANQQITADWGFAFGYGFLTANIDVDLLMYVDRYGKYWGVWTWNG